MALRGRHSPDDAPETTLRGLNAWGDHSGDNNPWTALWARRGGHDAVGAGRFGRHSWRRSRTGLPITKSCAAGCLLESGHRLRAASRWPMVRYVRYHLHAHPPARRQAAGPAPAVRPICVQLTSPVVAPGRKARARQTEDPGAHVGPPWQGNRRSGKPPVREAAGSGSRRSGEPPVGGTADWGNLVSETAARDRAGLPAWRPPRETVSDRATFGE